MTKLPRDARAFAQRVKMGKKRLWVLVEGREHDTAFYDRLVHSHPKAREGGHGVRLSEQIQLNGKSAGGKTFAYELHDYFASENYLAQSTRDGTRQIAFALDRDLDHIDGSLRESEHIIYTHALDVEAEILINGDMQRAVSSAYSITTESAARIVSSGVTLASELAELWRAWITLGVVSAHCGMHNEIRFGKKSTVNSDLFGPVDEEKLTSIEDRIFRAIESEKKSQQIAIAVSEVDAHYSSGNEWRLIKGKWLVSYVSYLAKNKLEKPFAQNTQAATVARTCLETLDFSKNWAEHYRERLTLLLVQ